MTVKSNTPLSPLTPLQWFMKKGYAQGVFWALMICLVSVTNDIFMRFLGQRLPVWEIVFFRFLFSLLSLVPFLARKETNYFFTRRPGMHLLRAVLGVGAIGATCYAVNNMPLSSNTVIMFTEPLFFLPFAMIFLSEKVGIQRWIATLIGFAGILIVIKPGTADFKLVSLVSVAAAIQFSLLNVVAKKMVDTESSITMLFYFSLGTTLAGLIPLYFVWTAPTLYELGLLFLLGIGANLIQVCLFRAFSATDASALMPFRYVEFIFSAIFGFILFAEIPAKAVIAGTLLIIASTSYISYAETRREAKKLAA